MAKVLTVSELGLLCKNLVNCGKGDKKIMISSDDEGNEYHELFFGFTENVDDLFSGEYGPFLPCGVEKENLKDYIVLG